MVLLYRYDAQQRLHCQCREAARWRTVFSSCLSQLYAYSLPRTSARATGAPLPLHPPTLTSLNPLLPFLGLNLTADLTYNILHINKATRIEAGIFYLRSRCIHIHNTIEALTFDRYLARFPVLQGVRGRSSTELSVLFTRSAARDMPT